MALSAAQQRMVTSLGRLRSEIAAEISSRQQEPTLQDLQAQLAEVETQLQAIDPTIPPLSAESAEAGPALK